MTNIQNEREAILSKVRARAVDEIAAVLDERWPEIVADLDRASIEASKADKRCKFRIGISVVVEPAGNRVGLTVKAQWGCRKSIETEREEISLTPDLPGIAE